MAMGRMKRLHGIAIEQAADEFPGRRFAPVAVFPTVEGNFRYAVDMEGYGALQFFNEERLVLRLH